MLACGGRRDEPMIGASVVNQEILTERLFHMLISGERTSARQLVGEALNGHYTPETLATEVCWPLMDMIGTLYRSDQMTNLAQHYSTRLLRSLVDQLQVHYVQKPRRNKKLCMFCGPNEGDDLCAQLVADLAEADGYQVYFGGGGVANDEILAEVNEQRPDILLMFSSAAQDAPNIRRLIDTIRGVNAWEPMQIVVGGGVFNRAPGLAEEIGADLWAVSPKDLLEQLVSNGKRRANSEQRTVGKGRKNKVA
jgi:methanogenic corrinoid protein MtbC1